MSMRLPRATFNCSERASSIAERFLNPNGTRPASHLQRIIMKTLFIVCTLLACASRSALSPKSQPFPRRSAPRNLAGRFGRASATASAPGDLGDQIRRRFDKKVQNRRRHIRDRNATRTPSRIRETPCRVDFGDEVIPIVGIIFAGGLWDPGPDRRGRSCIFGFSKSRSLHRTVRLMVEKGQEVPAALLNPPATRATLRHAARRCAHHGRHRDMIFFGAVDDWEGGAWALGDDSVPHRCRLPAGLEIGRKEGQHRPTRALTCGRGANRCRPRRPSSSR